MDQQDAFIETSIVPLIKEQFPDYYKESGPILIALVQEYYKWLELPGNPLYYARRHLVNHDIDLAADEFLIYFKNKYTPSIQLDTVENTRNLVKNSLPLYRSKGTDDGFDLFFQMVFGVNAEVYHPGDDLFSLSTGDWHKDFYLEISPMESNKQFIGQSITGVTSGAIAYVDRLVRRNILGKFVEVLYISSLQGNFQTGELIYLSTKKDLLTAPTIVGSLSSLVPIDGGMQFKIGDKVTVNSPSGIKATARIANTFIATGLVDFNLIDGGWGYSSNAQIFVSDSVLSLTNLYRPISFATTIPQYRGKVYQPLANVSYQYSNGKFNPGDIVSTYYANGTASGVGRVLLSSNTTSGNGFIFMSVLSGNLQQNTVYKNQGNTVTANIYAGGYTNLTANGALLNIPNYFDAYYDTANGIFQTNEQVYQIDQYGKEIANGYVKAAPKIGTNGLMQVVRTSTVFYTNTTIYGRASNSYANLNYIRAQIGLQTNSTYTAVQGNWIYDSDFFANATVQAISFGYGASFLFSNSMSYSENVRLNTDFIRDYVTMPLAATDYTANLHFANLDYLPIANALNYPTINIGKIQILTNINPGNNYNFSPIVSIYEPFVAPYDLHDYIMTLSNPTGVFVAGEIITQANTGAIGLVQSANSTTVYVQRLTFEDRYVANVTGSSFLLYGESSNVSAFVKEIKNNYTTLPIGENANIQTDVISSNGAVSELQVLASGFGFNRSIKLGDDYEDIVTFTSQDGLRSGTAIAHLDKQGTTEGYYRDRKSFLSSDKKLLDSDYYQMFSYDIQSPVSPEKYKDMLENLLHIAGKKYFCSVVRPAYLDGNSHFSASIQTISINGPSLDFTKTLNSQYIPLIGGGLRTLNPGGTPDELDFRQEENSQYIPMLTGF